MRPYAVQHDTTLQDLYASCAAGEDSTFVGLPVHDPARHGAWPPEDGRYYLLVCQDAHYYLVLGTLDRERVTYYPGAGFSTGGEAIFVTEEAQEPRPRYFFGPAHFATPTKGQGDAH